MALYQFHRVLIVVSILFDVFFSIYCYRKWLSTNDSFQLWMLVGSSVVTLGMIAYLIYFNRKLTYIAKPPSTGAQA